MHNEVIGGAEDESVPPETQNCLFSQMGTKKHFQVTIHGYFAMPQSRADVTKLLFKTDPSTTDVSYTLHIQCHVTCKCAFLTDLFPILPQEKSLVMSSIRGGAATAKVTQYLFTHAMAGPAPKQQQLASSSRQTKGT